MTSDFLKQEKDRLSRRLIDDLLLSDEQVPLKRILEGKYPVLFQELAKREAQKILVHENPLEVKANKRFDFDGEKFKTQLCELKKALLLETVFTAEEIKKFAEFSVGLQLDIIVKPRQTFLNILFKKKNEVDKSDAIEIIAGFGEERPFARKLIAALENENTTKIERDEVNRLTEKIERKVYKLTPISSFLTDVGLYRELEISITGDYQTLFRSEILQEMLVKRDLNALSKAISVDEERDFWTITEIENAFERFLLVGNLEQEQPLKTGKEKAAKRKSMLSEKRQKSEEAEKRQVSFLEEFSRSKDEPASPQSGSAAKGHAEPNEAEPQNGATQDNGRNSSRGGENNRPTISTLINSDDKDFLVSTIFDNQTDEFSMFIEKLDEINKWQTARVAINEEIVKRNISPYSKEAILLGDVVFSKYFTAK